jgi:hypothetical protein
VVMVDYYCASLSRQPRVFTGLVTTVDILAAVGRRAPVESLVLIFSSSAGIR